MHLLNVIALDVLTNKDNRTCLNFHRNVLTSMVHWKLEVRETDILLQVIQCANC